MKTPVTLILVLSFNILYSQCDNYYGYCLEFDDTICLNHLTIDTSGFPDNIWQIGNTQKPDWDANCDYNAAAVITDTLNSYPINNHSVFTITTQATDAEVYGFRIFSGKYYVQTDSINDYGAIELSLDKGVTWIDIINDTVHENHFSWFSAKPVLTGHSGSCRYFDVNLSDLRSIQDFQLGDTILYRFSFFSDSIFDNLDGLLFDIICFNEFVEGISETRFKAIKSIVYPNPSEGIVTVEFDNPATESFELAVYDMHSKQLLARNGITENKIVIDARSFQSGIYVYKLTCLESQKRAWGRFNLEK